LTFWHVLFSVLLCLIYILLFTPMLFLAIRRQLPRNQQIPFACMALLYLGYMVYTIVTPATPDQLPDSLGVFCCALPGLLLASVAFIVTFPRWFPKNATTPPEDPTPTS
jgi:hypothetical protein